MKGRAALLVLGVFLAGLWCPTASAQITTGTVFGTVKDAQGGVLPGATVVLASETKGTKIAPVVTNETGDFVIPAVTADTYTVEISMPSFKTLSRKGVTVSGGDRVALGSLTLEVGTQEEIINVVATAPLLQANSGERSYVANPTQLQNLPLGSGGGANRNFANLASFAPGISGTSRIGGGGSTNIVMDGVSVMDTGNNSQMLQLNVEAIGEVKVLTSNYQAAYGRSSGAQITAVTRGGTNQFRGSIYEYKRNSNWDTNSWVNQKNGDPKSISKQDDWGYMVGGPVGRPGGDNKLFFFYGHEFRPRTGGGNITRFRVPTALERQGDFSQTRDNQGALYPYIRDYTTGLPCSASDTRGCFQDGGVLGKIPASRLYPQGMAILNNPFWPLPNHTQVAGENYNYLATQPNYKTLSYQPSFRVDYQPKSTLRITGKFNGQNSGTDITPGSLPGYNDQITRTPGTQWITTYAFSGAWTINPTTFLEGTYGRARNYLAAMYVNDSTNINKIGLGSLPLLYPDARKIDQNYFGAQVLNSYNPVWYQNQTILLPPNWAWGNRIGCATTNNNAVGAPCIPNLQYPNALNTNSTYDISLNLTKVKGRHAFKGGFYMTHSFKAQNINIAMGALPFKSEMNFSEDTNNPYDAQFGYANAALGVLSTYYQQSKFVEGDYVYTNREWYIQDNWKATNRLTLDYGVRFANFQPQYDQYMHAANFFPDQWSLSKAPLLYQPGCPGGVYPCPTTRQAMDPRTGQLLGAGSAALIGFVIPGTGASQYPGLVQQGQQGTTKYGYNWPAVVVAPRFGAAYDLFGTQKVILRGGAGIFHDRMQSDTVQNMVSDPPFSQGVTLKYVRLQDITPGQTGASPAPKIFLYRYNADIPTSFQWVLGTQVALPWSSSIDLSYVGQRAWNQMNPYVGIADQNTVDIGAAFLPANQDPTRAASTVPGQNALVTDLMRGYRGYGAMSLQDNIYRRTYHSLQTQYTKRMTKGIQAGVSWTWSISDKGSTNLQPRYQHNADGTATLRSDWDQFVALMGNQGTVKHLVRGNWVWDFPNLAYGNSAGSRIAAALVNDWVLAGVYTWTTGTPYSVGFTYLSNGSSLNLTGSPDYPARIRIVGNTGGGCSGNQYNQFNTAAFAGPTTGSVGMESGQYYMDGCNDHTMDLSLQRNFPLGGNRRIQFRVDAFNALNTVVYSSRNTTVQYTSPTDQTVRNSQYLASGAVDPTRLTPRSAGFGAVTGAQAMRSIQISFRFMF